MLRCASHDKKDSVLSHLHNTTMVHDFSTSCKRYSGLCLPLLKVESCCCVFSSISFCCLSSSLMFHRNFQALLLGHKTGSENITMSMLFFLPCSSWFQCPRKHHAVETKVVFCDDHFNLVTLLYSDVKKVVKEHM